MITRNIEAPLQVLVGGSASSNGSRLFQYLSENNEKLGELMLEPGLRHTYASSDEGYQEIDDIIGSPPDDCPLNLRSNCAPEKKLEDATNMVILSNLPSDIPYSKEKFADDVLQDCAIDDAAEVKLSKLPDMIYIYNLSDSNQRKLASFMEQHFPKVHTMRTMGVPPYRHIEDITEMLLNILTANQCEEMSYKDIYEKAPKAYLILTKDFPFDTNRLVEVTQTGFYGVRLRSKSEKQTLDRRHLMFLISVRRLAPFVHQMISTEPRHLDQAFLESLGKLIVSNTNDIAEPTIVACAVNGEAHIKPLEHLVTCVPGVEVVWSDNKKVIRKLELPEKSGVEQTTRTSSGTAASPEAVRVEQDIVKTLSDILKKPSNLYMSLSALAAALKKQTMRLDKSLRQFITERPKHFQILGEADHEVVTLSHRAQIKRVCNDLQKVLRPRKPKCISSADIAAAFANHWKATNETDRHFNVEDFGVCYLDDLLVTIPQHWGVHCSEYVSTEGAVVRRTHGDNEEQIPDFVPTDASDRVYAWIPRHHQTESQRKSLALLKQQTLNMFRGDPSAETLIDLIVRHGRNHNPECTRLYRLAMLRAHRQASQQSSTLNGRDNPMLPCHFKIEEKTFVPLYHRFCGEQVTLSHYGVKDLYELFDSMQDTFIASGHGQERIISLTADARREILERRIVDILRSADRSLTEREIILRYREQPTMLPFFELNEIKRAIEKSRLIQQEGFGTPLYHAREFFNCSAAIAVEPDVAVVLKIFMMSYASLDIEALKRRFLAATNRPLNESMLQNLETLGAIRLVNEYEQKFDLHDICRVVRNLVYQMNEHPNKVYTVNPHYYVGTSSLLSHEVSVFSLLSFSGDYTYIEPSVLLRVMNDFTICFERVGQSQFQLRQELVVWVPTPEETEGVQSRRTNRGSHQTFRTSNRTRQQSRFQRHGSTSLHYQRPMQRSSSFGNNAH